MSQTEELAAIVDNAASKAVSIAQLSLSNSFDVDQAYAIQRKSMERRFSRGEKFIGVKMGFTSEAKMKQMGVHDLIFGILTDGMIIENGSTINFDEYIHPRAEPEIAFRISKDINRELSIQEVSSYVDGLASAIEIIDSRYENFKFNLEDVLADNCSAIGLVIGEWKSSDTDINDLAMSLSFDGEVKREGSSSAILGNPWKSLQHAARLANKYGWPIKAGSIVLAGAATPAEYLSKGIKVKTEVDSLGSVGFSIGD